MEKGERYVVHVHLDEDSYRIMASAKVERYLSSDMPPYHPGDGVEILVWQRTDLGYKVIVDNRFGGLIYATDVVRPLSTGTKTEAYVRQVRPDGKIDIVLQPDGPRKVDDFAEVLLDYIRQHDGFTTFQDKTPAEDIYATFGVSKKTFKKAVGDLYKKHLVTLEEGGIRLCEKPQRKPRLKP